MKKDITRLFCLVDDFLKALEEERKKKQIEDGKKRRKPTRTPCLTESEIATIVLIPQLWIRNGEMVSRKGRLSRFQLISSEGRNYMHEHIDKRPVTGVFKHQFIF